MQCGDRRLIRSLKNCIQPKYYISYPDLRYIPSGLKGRKPEQGWKWEMHTSLESFCQSTAFDLL